MQNKKPILFVEINNLNFIFVAGIYDENQKFKVIEKIITISEGINKNKFINIEQSSHIIKKNVESIESKLNVIFKDVIIILENFDYSCINISGFKKLNGSQVLKENISYILNSLKLIISEQENQKTILHIFNSKSSLDNVEVENLPIGLYGDFYSHELTFFLIGNNDLKNINQIFNKNNLEVKKIVLKNYSECTQLIAQDDNETFFKIKINLQNSNISYFENASFRYSEDFNFGTSVIFKDVIKICSINKETIENFLSEFYFDETKFNDNVFLEERYFTNEKYRKIRKKLIFDIINARIEEIVDIILNKNINLSFLKQKKIKVYLLIKDKLISDKFEKNFKLFFLKYNNVDIHLIRDFEVSSLVASAADLSIYGWKKEAIPITQTKNSIITRIFKSIFG